jgi:mRNA-degrading endonuclease toxin of MazEF toxin-antitoxin module
MAAGSVMNEPKRGAIVRIDIHHAAGVLPPRPATARSARAASVTTGRVDASAMMTTTNKGSV